jgi:hypothetical protein
MQHEIIATLSWHLGLSIGSVANGSGDGGVAHDARRYGLCVDASRAHSPPEKAPVAETQAGLTGPISFRKTPDRGHACRAACLARPVGDIGRVLPLQRPRHRKSFTPALTLGFSRFCDIGPDIVRESAS